MHLELPQPFRTIADVEAGLAAIERAFTARNDVRGAFATTYLASTRQQCEWLSRNRFADGPWIERAMVAFANLYLSALKNYESGRFGLVPEPWRQALSVGRQGGSVAAVHGLLLSINAHVNHDLPFALAEVGLGIDGASRLDDHTRLNGTLCSAAPEVRDRVTAQYAPKLRLAGRLFGKVIDRVVAAVLAVSRQRAWHAACELADSATVDDRNDAAERIHERSALIGRLMLARRPAPTPSFQLGHQLSVA